MNFVIVCLEVIIGPITVSFTGVANLERKQFHREPKEFSNSVKGRGKTKQGANLKTPFFQLVLIWDRFDGSFGF